LPVERILSNQVSELFRNVSFIAIGAVLASKDIGGEFWHLGVHLIVLNLTVRRINPLCLSSFDEIQQNLTKWSQKRSTATHPAASVFYFSKNLCL
jgi:hypothetical protein